MSDKKYIDLGQVTAYAYAKEHGYTGTEEEFGEEQAQFAQNAQQVAEDRVVVREDRVIVREDREHVDEVAEAFTGTTAPEAVQRVTTEGNTQVARVQDEGDTQVDRVQDEGDTQVTAVRGEGNTQVSRVQGEGNTQVAEVQDEGDTQVTRVQNEGDTKVSLIQTEGATQVQAVEDKGEEVLSSIPENYEDKIDEVNDYLTNVIKVSDVQPQSEVNKLWIKDQVGQEYTVPTYEEFEPVLNAIGELGGKTRNLNTAGVGRYRATNTGVIQPDPGSTTIFGMDDLVECDGDTAYTVTIYDLNAGDVWIYLCWYDANKNYLTENNGNGLSITKTSPSSAKYMYVHTYKGGTGIPDISDGKIQIEKGTESTDYVPPFSAIDVVARNEIEKLNTTVSGLPAQSDFTEIQTQLNKTVAEQNTGIEYLSGIFQNGTLADGVFQDYAKFRVATDTIMTYDRAITLTIASGYKIGIHIFINGVFNRDSGWITNGHYTIPEGTEFKCVIAKNPEDTSIIADVDTFVSAVTFPTYTQDQIDSISAGSEPATALSTLLEYDKAFGKRYVCHFGTPYYDGMIIPSQSKFDIERARKAGFTAIEFNLQTTSDGKYIVGHGVGGKFGNEFYHVDGDDITNVAFNSFTLAYIKEKIRLKSAVEKYKVPPLTLEEALICCKNNGIMPAITYTADAFAIAEKIMGKDNFIALVYANDRPSGFHGACASWYRLTDKNEILARCQASGGAYSMGLDVTNAAYSDFTLDDWKEITDLLHENGYRVNAAYVIDPNLQHVLEKAGFDYIFSMYQVPEINNGNVCNLSDNNTFADFNHNGTVTDGKLILTTDQTVEPSETYSASLSSGGSLHISFTGSIRISMTSYINNTYTSNDPTDDWWFSTYYNGTAPTFKITAVGNATINELSFKASRY